MTGAIAEPSQVPLGLIVAFSYCERHTGIVAARNVEGGKIDRQFVSELVSCRVCEVKPYNQVALQELIGKVVFGPSNSMETRAATAAVALRVFMDLMKGIREMK